MEPTSISVKEASFASTQQLLLKSSTALILSCRCLRHYVSSWTKNASQDDILPN